ncbi:dual specificity phosphatase 12 [Coelomomyces lativittatus]|nr:dual specificity phosphatase 12 [Coelomomyces lativittatus]KAJ1516161.1 dual specificity phosphatase 12 [Coelomomyces lativittatus]
MTESTSLAWMTPHISICSLTSFEAHLDQFQQVMALVPFSHGLQKKIATLSMHVYSLDLEDTWTQDIFKYLDACVEWMVHAVHRNQKVALVCVSGISRSVSIGMAYFIKHQGWSYTEALVHLQTVRPVACPNESFAFQLHIYARGHTTQTSGYAYILQVLLSLPSSAPAWSPWSTLPCSLLPPSTKKSFIRRSYVCRQCRHLLFDSTWILPDPLFPSHHAGNPPDGKTSKGSSTSSFQYHVIFPPPFHGLLHPQRQRQGKLMCPHELHHQTSRGASSCQAKLGTYQWIVKSGVGGPPQRAPGFWITKSAVDVVEPPSRSME